MHEVFAVKASVVSDVLAAVGSMTVVAVGGVPSMRKC